MGLTYLDVMVAHPGNPDERENVRFLVDSGAVYSVVQRAVLDRLGIRPVSRQEFRLANGETIGRERGFALFRLGERIGASTVLFGEEGDSTLLGAVTLEELGLILDPIRRELKPLPMVL